MFVGVEALEDAVQESVGVRAVGFDGPVEFEELGEEGKDEREGYLARLVRYEEAQSGFRTRSRRSDMKRTLRTRRRNCGVM